MFVHKIALILVVLAATSDVPVLAQRGKTRPRIRPGVPGHMNSITSQDVNSKMEYYNSPAGAKITKHSHFDLEYVLGHKVTFLCEAKGEPRPHITWFKDGTEIYSHPFIQIHEWPLANNVIKSKMEIDPATQMDAGLYECHANNKFSIDRRTFKADFSLGE